MRLIKSKEVETYGNKEGKMRLYKALKINLAAVWKPKKTDRLHHNVIFPYIRTLLYYVEQPYVVSPLTLRIRENLQCHISEDKSLNFIIVIVKMSISRFLA